MNDLDKILKIIENAPDEFESKIPDIEKKIFRDVSLLLKDLKTSPSGKIETSIDNLKLINEIKSKLGKIVVSKEYSNLVNKFVSSIPDISNFQTSTAGLTNESKKMMTAVAKAQIDSTLESLIGSGYKQEVVSKLYNTLLTNVTSGGSYADLTEQLRNQLITTEEKPSVLSKYAKTFVTDSLGQFAGQGNKMIADTLGSEWFQYVGSNLTTTREFCEHLRKKRYVHISEFPTLLKGEIDGHKCKIYEATGLPYGMKEDTNVDNFIENRGGWNCGHELIPVSKLTVPQAVREKIIIKRKENTSGVSAEPEFNDDDLIRKYPNLFSVNSHLELKNELEKSISKYLKFADFEIKEDIDLGQAKALSAKLLELTEKYKTEGIVTKVTIKKYIRGSFGKLIIDKLTGNRTFEISEKYEPIGYSKTDKDKQLFANLTHEFAHLMAPDTIKGNKKFAPVEKLYNQYVKEINRIKTWDKRYGEIYLGRYSKESIDDFFAEAFQEYKNCTNPSEYARKVGEFVEKNLLR